MMNLTPLEISSIAGVLLLFVGTVITVQATKGKTKSDAKAAMDARIDEKVNQSLERAWTRIELLEEHSRKADAKSRKLEENVRDLNEKDRMKSSAMARILRAIEKQWPDEHGPDLDPADIEMIEDTIPASWVRSRRTAPGTPPPV